MIDYISFEDYCEKYHSTGILLAGKYQKKPTKALNDNQLKTYYNTHIKKLEKIEYAKANSPSDITKDQIIRQECVKRDRGRCRLMSVVTQNEMRELINNSIPLLLHKLDTAHVFGKNAYPKMRYVLDNVVLLNRA
jgi:aminopeptidase C